MAKLSRAIGSTSHILTLFIQDSSKTDGSGLTGLTNASASLTCYYKRNTASASAPVTLDTISTLGTYGSYAAGHGGFKEIDATNMPGCYEFQPPDAAFASGAKSVAFILKGATNMAPCLLEIELTAVDNQDAVRYGMTAIPNVAQGNAGQLPTADASGRVTGAANVLDAVAVTDPGAPANWTTFPKIMVALYRRFLKPTSLNATQLTMLKDDGVTTNATQAVSDNGTTQTVGAAS